MVEQTRGRAKVTHPLIYREAAVAHGKELVETAERARIAADRAVTGGSAAIPAVLAGLGSLVIAAGERLGSVRARRTGDLIDAAR